MSVVDQNRIVAGGRWGQICYVFLLWVNTPLFLIGNAAIAVLLVAPFTVFPNFFKSEDILSFEPVVWENFASASAFLLLLLSTLQMRRFARRHGYRKWADAAIQFPREHLVFILTQVLLLPLLLIGSAVAGRLGSFYWDLGHLAWLMSVPPALILLLYVVLAPHAQVNNNADSSVIRGTEVHTYQAAVLRARKLLGLDESQKQLTRRQPSAEPKHPSYTIEWAGLPLPGDIESHFGIVGISGSGKTLALQSLMRSVLPTICAGDVEAPASRALVFDPENKLVPFLSQLVTPQRLHILNPFDVRSRPWDIANDVEDLATAQEMAAIFIAEQKGDATPFWQRTARGILAATLKALHMKAQGRWTLRQVFHIVTNHVRLRAVLGETKQTQALIELLRPTKQTLFNVLAELRSHMDMLELVAALWDQSVHKRNIKPFTLKEWLSENSVLVFGRPTQLEDTILALNRVLIKRASQLIRAPMSNDALKARGRTWIFLDELRNIGSLPGLDKLLTEGRSRGARVAITFQDIDGLREVYGERVAEEIANQCDTMSYLRCRGTTAKWSTERLGRCQYWSLEYNSGQTRGTSGDSPTDSQSSGSAVRKTIDDSVLESELMNLPPVSLANVGGDRGAFVQGWHVIPCLRCVFSAKENDAWYRFEEFCDAGRFCARPPEDQILRPWDDEQDWLDLGFKPDLTGDPLPDVEDSR